MAKSEKSVTTSISALGARSQFGQILRRASGKKRERFVVGLRGRPTAVIMGIDDFLSTIGPEPKVLAAIRERSVRNGTSSVPMSVIDREIAAARRERPLRNSKTSRRS